MFYFLSLLKATSEATDKAGGGNGGHSLHEQEVGEMPVAADKHRDLRGLRGDQEVQGHGGGGGGGDCQVAYNGGARGRAANR